MNNIFAKFLVVAAALASRTGSFTFVYKKTRYVVTITASGHTVPLSFTLQNLYTLATQILTTLSGSSVIRINNLDYTIKIAPAA